LDENRRRLCRRNHRRQAMHTLFRSIANGLSWDVVVRPLIQVGWLWGPWAQQDGEPGLGLNGSWFLTGENRHREPSIFP
jgi:hypothetical protein